MSQDNIGNTPREASKCTTSFNGAHKLRPKSPKVVEPNSATHPNTLKPSASSEGNGLVNTDKPDGTSYTK